MYVCLANEIDNYYSLKPLVFTQYQSSEHQDFFQGNYSFISHQGLRFAVWNPFVFHLGFCEFDVLFPQLLPSLLVVVRDVVFFRHHPNLRGSLVTKQSNTRFQSNSNLCMGVIRCSHILPPFTREGACAARIISILHGCVCQFFLFLLVYVLWSYLVQGASA